MKERKKESGKYWQALDFLDLCGLIKKASDRNSISLSDKCLLLLHKNTITIPKETPVKDGVRMMMVQTILEGHGGEVDSEMLAYSSVLLLEMIIFSLRKQGKEDLANTFESALGNDPFERD